jgi:hypothetical protein
LPLLQGLAAASSRAQTAEEQLATKAQQADALLAEVKTLREKVRSHG